MRLDLRVSAWRGVERLERDVPVASWTWTEKHAVMPAGKLALEVPGTWWPSLVTSPLRPMGQTLRCELHHDRGVAVLPPMRIQEVAEGVSVAAESIDRSITEDPWPYPSSPATGATLLQEATRLAAPLPVRLEIPDGPLPDGLAWSGDRDEALLDLVVARAARWQVSGDGTLVAVPLGSVSEPERTYTASEIVDAPRKLTRSRVSKATVVAQASGDEPSTVIVRRLTQSEYQPDVYGSVGKVQSISSGATLEQLEEAATALLAEGGGERDFEIVPDPTLRAGMIARLKIEHRDGPEIVVGRVVSHSLKSNGSHTITIQEA